MVVNACLRDYMSHPARSEGFIYSAMIENIFLPDGTLDDDR